MKVMFVQIGDIHIQESGNSFPLKRIEFFNAIKNSAKFADHVFLLLTGDIANTGSRKEYEYAKNFIRSFKRKIHDYSGKNVHVISVPGNHDCDFSRKESKAREGLINLIQNNGSDAIDDSVLEVCTSIQKNYRDFYDEFEEKSSIIHQSHLITVYQFNFPNKKILFYCYNTAYMSVLHEQPGKMVMPVSIFPDEYFTKKADFAVSLYHHPANWNNPNNRREFLFHLNKTSDMQITGHEHVYSKTSLDDMEGDRLYCVESDVLQEIGRPEVSGFNEIILDFESQMFLIRNFKWKGAKYCPDYPQDHWHGFFRSAAKATMRYDISRTFQGTLTDPGANFTHRNKANLTLQDIFVYPALKLINFNESANSDSKLEIIESESLIKSLASKFQIVIIGDENIGKTAFLRTVYKQLNEKQFVPVFVDGHSINSTDFDDFSKLINKNFGIQYASDYLEDFLQLDLDKVVIIIDDFDKSNLKIKYRARFLNKLKASYPNFIISASDLYQFEEMVSEEIAKGDNIYESLAQYEIQEFGWRLQNKLINKWNTLGLEELLSDADRIRRNEDTHQIIKTVIGKNFIPKYPVFLLTILQSIEGGNPLDLQTSSFGHYYYYLIVKTLKNIVPNPSDLTTYINFISELSYHFYSRDVKTIDEYIFKEFHKKYKIDYSISDTYKEILSNLIKANIIENFDGNYEFKYAYQYYFFLAKYFADNIELKEVRDIISNLCKKLHIAVNANIILFLTHHSKDEFILDRVLENSRAVFSEFEPAKLQNEIQSINNLSDNLPRLVLENLNVDQNRDSHFAEMDEMDGNGGTKRISDDSGATSDLDLVAQLNSAFKNIEILGQILKNNYGKIKTARKMELAEEAYSSGLRSLSLFFKAIDENSDYFINQITTLIDPEKVPNKIEIGKMSRTLLFNFCSQISYNFIRKISDSLGSEKLEEILSKIPEKHDFNSYHLVDLSVKLDYYKGFPEASMLENAKNMNKNALAFEVVRKLVWRHLHLYPTNYQQKQQIGAILKISIPSSIVAQREINR